MARSLLRSKSRTIALIIPDLSNPFFAELFFGIEEAMSREGYYVFVCNTNYRKENEHRYIKEMIGRGVDGMVFMRLYHCDEEIINLVQSNVSAVAVQTQIKGVDLVRTDVSRAGIEACKHLFERKHRKIGYVCLNKNRTVERLAAYMTAHEEAGVPVREEYIVDGFTPDSLGYLATKRLLELPDPPTAIQFFNDYTALGAYNAILERGLRIPRDISVIGYDDINIARLLSPPLTTVAQPIQELGRRAGEMLLSSIDSGLHQAAEEIHLSANLVVRGSTGVPAGER